MSFVTFSDDEHLLYIDINSLYAKVRHVLEGDMYLYT